MGEKLRKKSLDAGLERLGAEALVVVAESGRDVDLASFVGPVHLGSCFVVWPRVGDATLGYLADMERQEAADSGLMLLGPEELGLVDLRKKGSSQEQVWISVLRFALRSASVTSGTVALAGHPPAGRMQAVARALEKDGFSFVNGRDLVRRLRKTKSQAELDEIRRTAAETETAFRAVASVLAETRPAESGELRSRGAALTAGHLRRVVSRIFADAGLEQPEGNIVAAGADAGVPHTQGDDGRILRAHEAIVVDLYPRSRLFADCARTFCIGAPPHALAKGHELCLEALEGAAERAKVGIRAADLQSFVCDLFEGAGYSTLRTEPAARSGYVHGLGHGVGFELHELPTFRKTPETDGCLEVADVFTLEPGLYDPDEGYGVRLENLYLMSGSGPENLTRLPYDLDPEAWLRQSLR